MAAFLNPFRAVNTFLNKHQDSRTADFPLMSSPFYTLGICLSYVYVVKMPKKSTVSSEEILLAAIDEELILNDDGNIPGPSHEIWRRLSIKLECRTSPKNIYTRVKGNRENLFTSIMNKKGVACDKRSDGEADSLRGSETSHNEETKDQEEESIEHPTKTFKVVLSADDFKKMKPVYTKLKMKKLGKLRARYTLPLYIWAEQIGKLLWEQHRIPCPFALRNSQVNVDSKLGEQYIKVNAYCRDPKCNADATGIVLEKPIEDEPVIMEWRCRDTRDRVHSKKKYLRGIEREDVGKTIARSSATIYRRHLANSLMDNMGKHEPPFLYTPQVLRKAKQEFKDIQYDIVHGNDPVLCLEIMKHIQPHCGSIHDIGMDKFFVHYYSPLQQHVYRILCRSQYLLLTIDATGSLVKRILRDHGPSHHIFLYEGVVRTAINQIPVVQMLSEKQDANSILYWLIEWQRNGAPTPNEVVIDDSKALISATVRCFAKCSDIKDYKERCFRLLNGEIEQLPACYIRIDVAHFVKAVARWKLWKVNQLNRLKEFYMRCLGLLIKAVSFREFQEILTNILLVSMSPDEGFDDSGSTLPMETALKYLISKIRGEYEIQTLFRSLDQHDTEVCNVDDDDDCDEQETSEEENSTSKSLSLWLKGIQENVERHTTMKGSRLNPYFSHAIGKKFMAISSDFVLWSSVLVQYFGSHNLTASSAPVESDFSDLKTRIFINDIRPMLVHKFIDTHLKSIDGLLKQVNYKIHIVYQELQGNNLQKPTNCQENTIELGTKGIETDTSDLLKSHNDEFKPRQIPTLQEEMTVKRQRLQFPERAEDQHEIDDHETVYERDEFRMTPKHEQSLEEAPHDLNWFENWRKKGTIQVKKKPKYLYPHPELTQRDSILKVIKKRLVLNGNLCRAVKQNQTLYYMVKKTCPFDALVSVLAICYIQSSSYRSFVDANENITMQAAKCLATEGASSNLYRFRSNALTNVLSPTGCTETKFKNNYIKIVEYDAWSNLIDLTKRLLHNVFSATISVDCPNENCARLKDENYIVLSTDSGILSVYGFEKLATSIGRSMKILKNVEETNIFHFSKIPQCSYLCRGSPTLTITGHPHLLVEMDYMAFSDEAKNEDLPFNRTNFRWNLYLQKKYISSLVLLRIVFFILLMGSTSGAFQKYCSNHIRQREIVPPPVSIPYILSIFWC